MDGISKETLKRLPGYLNYLKELQKQGVENISSTAIADRFRFNAVQVRKDLASVGESGRPKTGFSVNCLVNDISEFLGFNNVSEAIIAGVGNLGKALISYDGFKDYGLEIVAGFDINPPPNTRVYGKEIFDIKRLPELVKKFDVMIGIITVPKEKAQEVCDLMIKGGIIAIWNFSPANLIVPNNVAVMNMDMASSLAILSQRLRKILNKTDD